MVTFTAFVKMERILVEGGGLGGVHLGPWGEPVDLPLPAPPKKPVLP